MSTPPSPKLAALTEKYMLDPLWLYQEVLIVDGLAHLSQSAHDQFELLSGLKILERSQLTDADLQFLNKSAHRFELAETTERKGASTHSDIEDSEVTDALSDNNQSLEYNETEAKMEVPQKNNLQESNHSIPEPVKPKIALSSDPFVAKAELLMHLCKLQSSWELSARELIKCIVHVGYRRGQLFFEPKAGKPVQMHWQKIGRSKLFLGKPVAIEQTCLDVIEQMSAANAGYELSIGDPILDFYAYDEVSKNIRKLAWVAVSAPFRLSFILEASDVQNDSIEMQQIITQSAENAFSV
jgi:hypothetical protein